ncbi:MAG: hypothetical protein WCG99_02640 [Candidatus Berkelbacteria bacterium]
MKTNSNNLLSKILFAVLLLACVICFVLARFITEASFIIISALALVAVISAEKLKYGVVAALGFLVVAMEFFHLLPLPYNYLFSHGLTMGSAILVTILAAAGYVAVAIFIALIIFKSKDKQ